jgi:hypothetical protein
MPKLRDLKPEELDIMQSALAGDTIQGLLDGQPQHRSAGGAGPDDPARARLHRHRLIAQ